MKNRPSLASRRAFTLIELLIVIAIIAILAALLLPALSSAKRQSQGVKCLNNVKQLDLAWVMYAQDNVDHLCVASPNPSTATPDPLNGCVWCLQSEDFSDSWWNYDPLCEIAGSPQAANAIASGVFYPYVNNAGVYKCPADTSTVSHQNMAAGPANFPAGIYPRVRSVSMNFFLGGFGGVGAGGSGGSTSGSTCQWGNYYGVYTKTSDLIATQSPGPASTWVFLDERQDCINWGNYMQDMAGGPACSSGFTPSGFAFFQDMPGFYHGNSCCFSFADGHSELHHWQSPVTCPPLQGQGQVSTAKGALNGPAVNTYVAANDLDVEWIMLHTAMTNDL